MYIGNPAIHEIGSGTKLLFTFSSLKVFRHEERKRESRFLSILTFPSDHHHVPTMPPQTTWLASASSKNRLSSSKPKSQLSKLILLLQITNSTVLKKTFKSKHNMCNGLNYDANWLYQKKIRSKLDKTTITTYVISLASKRWQFKMWKVSLLKIVYVKMLLLDKIPFQVLLSIYHIYHEKEVCIVLA